MRRHIQNEMCTHTAAGIEIERENDQQKKRVPALCNQLVWGTGTRTHVHARTHTHIRKHRHAGARAHAQNVPDASHDIYTSFLNRKTRAHTAREFSQRCNVNRVRDSQASCVLSFIAFRWALRVRACARMCTATRNGQCNSYNL